MIRPERAVLGGRIGRENFRAPVKLAMNTKVTTIPHNANLGDLPPIFEKGYVAVVVKDGKFEGIITRIDLLNHLRQKM